MMTYDMSAANPETGQYVKSELFTHHFGCLRSFGSRFSRAKAAEYPKEDKNG
jgi:hypothetical protein